MRKSLYFAAFLLCSLAILVRGSSAGRIALEFRTAGDPVRWYKVWAPERDFGYVLGDTIRLEAEIAVSPGFNLDSAEIAGGRTRFNSWLELWIVKEERHYAEANVFRVIFTYQIFYVPDAVTALEIPEYVLKFSGPSGEAFRFVVPEFKFSLAPLTGEEDRAKLNLAEDKRPRPPDKTLVLVGLAASLVFLLGMLTLFFAPIIRRSIILYRQSPFRRAISELQRVGRLKDALVLIHRALNDYAGRAVFRHTLEKFLGEHPEFLAARDELEQMFAVSERIFFKDASAAFGEPEFDPVRIQKLLQKLHFLERKSGRSGKWMRIIPGF